ncbi:hypothetical protein [Streptomyces pristinaespiralis]|uniref:hypothetical protein n=1 Tax=Streptomyces pristinaespiralis TaxID=38300 RepID=UPI0033D39F39
MTGTRHGVIQSILRGCAAGAAGTTALNAVTYADMALRGRSASGAPEGMVERITTKLGHAVPGSADGRENRLSGLGALSGIAVGCGAGTVVSVIHGAGVRMPLWAGGLATGVLAMTVANLPMTLVGITDPRRWSASDWVSDVAPHIAYGLVTYGIVTASEQPR